MTKAERCKMNKKAAEDRIHATAAWQEAERLIAEMDRLWKAGNRTEANKLYWKVKRLRQEAKQ